METVTGYLDEQALRGRLAAGESMARHTSWKVGGPADLFFVPADEDDLTGFLAALPDDEPVTWIGLGSNVLVRDGGIRGAVISTSRMKDRLELLPGNGVRAGCGAACAKVARFSARSGLTGAEFMAGIPGSVGGALAMNAGAFGSETWDIVERVELVNRAGARTERTRAGFGTGYRRVDLASVAVPCSRTRRATSPAGWSNNAASRALLSARQACRKNMRTSSSMPALRALQISRP